MLSSNLSYLAWSLESAHACFLSDVMPCDRLRPRWVPRAPLLTPLAPPHRTSLGKNHFAVSVMLGSEPNP
ncbi:hypothetical protein EPR50_G00061400 [Perca flavescens]|uniref:Uncharacterized protein n=1 Tax=Perca flavescens TaxID=8167 RepID=A0A484D7K4_PERFV|nr:hypothetical protein EPR50_G00061400 [Perca flavescens]